MQHLKAATTGTLRTTTAIPPERGHSLATKAVQTTTTTTKNNNNTQVGFLTIARQGHETTDVRSDHHKKD